MRRPAPERPWRVLATRFGGAPWHRVVATYSTERAAQAKAEEMASSYGDSYAFVVRHRGWSSAR